MASLYTRIDQNKRQTYVIMLLFVGLITAIAWFFGQVYAGDGMGYLGIALIFSGFSTLISYYSSDKIVLAISGAHEVLESANPQLHSLVENLAIAAGLPKPKIYMIDDTALNAFATGRDPNHSVLCFTSGIVQALTKPELEGVIAHELSHVGNYDIRLMSIVSILVGTITLLADWFTRGMFYGSRRKDKDGISGIILLIGLGLILLSPLIATLIKLAVSRKREYLADASGAMLTRYPKGLADALKKIAGDHEILEAANGATAHLYISNPLKNSPGAFVSSLFNTHPPIEERIRLLEEM